MAVSDPIGGVAIVRATSKAEARALLLGATPPNSSFTQVRNFSAEQIDRAFRLGFRKPAWVWAARASDGATLGVVAGWGSKTRTTPFIFDFLDLPLGSPEVVRALLDRAVEDSAVEDSAVEDSAADDGAGRTRPTIEIIHFLPTDEQLDDPKLGDFVELLASCGFRLLVRRRRYRLDVLAGSTSVPETSLLFDSIEDAGDPRLPAVLEEILVGSLDAHDIDALRRGDLTSVARETANEYLEMDPVESMFLAIDPAIPDTENRVVGLVIGGLRGSAENGTASFIGVSHRHRGKGYAAQLLGWITKRMIGDGALFITGETDDDNFPMAAAFADVGYPHTESRIDFVRELGASRRVAGSE